MSFMTRCTARDIAGRIRAREGARGMRAGRQIGGCLPLRNSQTSIHWRKWIRGDRFVDDRDRRANVSTMMEGGHCIHMGRARNAMRVSSLSAGMRKACEQRMRDCDDFG